MEMVGCQDDKREVHEDTYVYACTIYHRSDSKIIFTTPWQEIDWYVKKHHIKDYVIIDDEDHDIHQKDYLVKTDYMYGLQERHYKDIKRILRK